jgi:hypothetical protein
LYASPAASHFLGCALSAGDAWHLHHSNTFQLSKEARIVCLRFGNDYTPECMEMDEMLYKIVDAVKDWVVIYVVDNKVVSPHLTTRAVSNSN